MTLFFPHMAYFSILKMAEVGSSKILVNCYQTSGSHITEYSTLHNNCLKNVNFHTTCHLTEPCTFYYKHISVCYILNELSLKCSKHKHHAVTLNQP